MRISALTVATGQKPKVFPSRFGWHADAALKPSAHTVQYSPPKDGAPVLPASVIQDVAHAVFRNSLADPGFATIRVERVPNPEAFGQFVYGLGHALGEQARPRTGSVYSPVWFSRRKFMSSTLPHQDMQTYPGIRSANRVTILGYVPSPVSSRLFVADVAQACRDSGQWSETLMQQTLNQPNFWARYARPVAEKSHQHYDVVLINDSEAWPNTQTNLGLAHFAIVKPQQGHQPNDRTFFQLVIRPDSQKPKAWVPIPPDKLDRVLAGQSEFRG